MTKLIALIVEDDRVFALPAWHRTITLMERRGLLVTHVAVVPSGNPYGSALRWLWYSSIFGVRNALRLALFGALERQRRKAEPRTWDEMAHTHALIVRHFKNANGPELLNFLRTSRCDVLHVLASITLTPAVLDLPRAGALSHHPSMLPSCRGTFPFIWARMDEQPVGQSFQQLTSRDPLFGPLLAQREATHPQVISSMLAFHVWTAQRYPELALDATQRLLANKVLPERTDLEASYHNVPERQDRFRFEDSGNHISTWADLRLTLSGQARITQLGNGDRSPAAGENTPAVASAQATTFRFPDVLPLRGSDSGGVTGKLLQMQPRRRRQASEG